MLIGDIDGDGRADYLLDPQNLECSGAATAFCGNGGCQISMALSGNGYGNALTILGGQPTLIQGESSVDVAIWVDGTNCHVKGTDQACWARLSWSGDKLHRTITLAPSGMTVVGIEESTALIWEDGAWTQAGAGAVVPHRNGHRIEVTEIPPPTSPRS